MPTNDFVFFPGIGSAGGYVYVSLGSKGLSSDSYALHVLATGDPTDHALPFAIK